LVLDVSAGRSGVFAAKTEADGEVANARFGLPKAVAGEGGC